MSLTLRRTRAADPAREAELPQAIEVEALHALLHERGEADLAAALLLRLTPAGAADLAALLARFRRRCSRPGFFRSYRRLLDAEGARQVDRTVAFLRGAGQAGCRVYPDPQADADEAPIATTHPRRLYPLPNDGATDRDAEGDGGDGGDGGETGASGGTPPDHPSPSIMPPWLPRPGGSAWDR